MIDERKLAGIITKALGAHEWEVLETLRKISDYAIDTFGDKDPDPDIIRQILMNFEGGDRDIAMIYMGVVIQYMSDNRFASDAIVSDVMKLGKHRRGILPDKESSAVERAPREYTVAEGQSTEGSDHANTSAV